jgi:hypothetical protein
MDVGAAARLLKARAWAWWDKVALWCVPNYADGSQSADAWLGSVLLHWVGRCVYSLAGMPGNTVPLSFWDTRMRIRGMWQKYWWLCHICLRKVVTNGKWRTCLNNRASSVQPPHTLLAESQIHCAFRWYWSRLKSLAVAIASSVDCSTTFHFFVQIVSPTDFQGFFLCISKQDQEL